MPAKNTNFNRNITFRCHDALVDLSLPCVMGILNITPDSFFDGGKHQNEDQIVRHVEHMISSGAGIIDVGAVSTRPGAKEISLEEEKARLFPVLHLLNKHFSSALFSVDTYRSSIAREAVEVYGASMINDISAGNLDKNMIKTIALLKVPYIIMHMQGTPAVMQKNPAYQNVISDIIQFFSEKTDACHQAGICDIIVDPGFGFGKTQEHNYKLLAHLQAFAILNKPLMVGISRKSMIQKVINKTASEALCGSVALGMAALQHGASFLRVHDVAETYEIVQLFKALNTNNH